MIEITKALPCDAEEIYAIYESLKGSPGCTWDDEYPTLEFVRHDIAERDSLYKLTEDGVIIAAAYLGDFEEREMPECFNKSVKRWGEFSRVGVRREYHRKGYAEKLLKFLLNEAVDLRYDGLALLVGTENSGAMALYEKIGFRRVGEGVMYETPWFFYERKLERNYEKDFLKLLNLIRPHPHFYLGACSITRLRSFLDGFSVGYSYPKMQPILPGFQDFIEEKYSERRTISWNHILLEASGNDEEKALELFFREFDEFTEKKGQ